MAKIAGSVECSELTESRRAIVKVQRLLQQILLDRPDLTGKVTLNFHKGNVSEKVYLEEAIETGPREMKYRVKV